MTKIEQKIPEGWSVKKLSEVSTFCGGSTPSRDHPEYFNGNIPWVKTTDLNNSVLYETEENITSLGLNNSSCKIIKNGAVCVAMYGGFNQIGRTCLLGIDATINQALTAIIPNEKLLNSYLLLYLTNNVRAWKSYAGSSRKDPNITKKDIESFKIIVPPLPEQEKIAGILGTWDEAIEKLSNLIEQKKLLKKGLMQQLLTGKTRLKGFTQLWKEVKLGNIGATYTGLSGKNKDNFGRGSYFIPYMNIYQNNHINPQQLEQVEVDEGEKQNTVKYGDIFFTTSSETPEEVGFASVLLFKPEQNIYLNSFCFGYRLNDFKSLLPEYASFLFRSIHVRKIMYKLAQGATRFNLSKNELMKEKIYLPSDISEQQAIANVLSTADDEINLLNQKLEALKEQKKGLMQQLLTGQTRVKVN